MSSDTLIVGLGITGLSVARYLLARGESFAVVDSRAQPPKREALAQLAPHIPVYTGPFDSVRLTQARRLIVSPGIPLSNPALQAAHAAGVALLSDIELFAREVQAPYAAITGSNGKSTVTTLLGEMARACGLSVGVGGNLGEAALDLLIPPPCDVYVLELSSFQLERVQSLKPQAAAVLNVSEDHLDHHGSLDAYIAAKARIFAQAHTAIYNRDDPITAAMPGGQQRISFGLQAPPTPQDYGLREQHGMRWLVQGSQNLIPVTQLALKGQHNMANALAALALGEALGLAPAPMLDGLRRFPGLAHRCQWVGQHRGVDWYNDSKATNLGATLAALNGLPAPIILIAGGQGKGQDFSPLAAAVKGRVRAMILLGEDAEQLAQVVREVVPTWRVADMAEAVQIAHQQAQPGDSVLLAPACASLDMFADYAHRGEVFTQQVRALLDTC